MQATGARARHSRAWRGNEQVTSGGTRIMISRKDVILVACLAAMLALAQPANAANWYVRPSSNGANNGIDWNNAWSTSSINWASVQPGDTIWLAGGTYASPLNPQANGTAQNLIYVKRVLSTDAVPVSTPGWNSSFDSQVIIAPSSGNVVYYSTQNTGNYMYFDGRNMNSETDASKCGIKLQKANSGGRLIRVALSSITVLGVSMTLLS